MGRGSSTCKDLEIEEQRGQSGWSEGPGRGARGSWATRRRVEFFRSETGTMRSTPVYKDHGLLPEALPGPRWVAAAFLDE